MPVDFLLAQGRRRSPAGLLNQRTAQLLLTKAISKALADAGIALDPLLLAVADRNIGWLPVPPSASEGRFYPRSVVLTVAAIRR